ncbi:hypothetical protein [Rhodopirellula bahusiensis]|uniref:hypothetical protein n=1 Tax=Rhodopirellula bahusiensis TaxID=2014065 RepID=UPI0018EB32DF|nr:hypothetical protein [Rhodopirellula bahusiensis]
MPHPGVDKKEPQIKAAIAARLEIWTRETVGDERFMFVLVELAGIGILPKRFLESALTDKWSFH